MKIETLKKSHKKEIILGVLILLIIATIILTTKAKYKSAQSIIS